MNEILEKIRDLAAQDRITFKKHALLQMKARCMDRDKVKQILLNPERLIRVDDSPLGPKYKIQGGPKRRKLAVGIEDERVVIITVM